MFESILIANRGEIACRIIATCRRLGVATVAVYSEADASARHVRLADQAVCVGPAAARDSYLRIDAIIEAAQEYRCPGDSSRAMDFCRRILISRSAAPPRDSPSSAHRWRRCAP